MRVEGEIYADIESYIDVIRGGIHTKVATRNVKRHLDVCGWVGFLDRCFTRGNLTLFEIRNKSFVLYAFISKNRHKQNSKKVSLFCIFFPHCLSILQLCVYFQYSIFLDCAILRKWITKYLNNCACFLYAWSHFKVISTL